MTKARNRKREKKNSAKSAPKPVPNTATPEMGRNPDQDGVARRTTTEEQVSTYGPELPPDHPHRSQSHPQDDIDEATPRNCVSDYISNGSRSAGVPSETGHRVSYRQSYQQPYAAQQYQSWPSHPHDLADMIANLRNDKLILKDELDKKDAEIRRLSKCEQALANLQAEKLQGADRYQPTFDVEILKALTRVESSINALVRKVLTKLDTSLDGAKWELEVSTMLYQRCINTEIDPKEFSRSRNIRKKALIGVLWKFLVRCLFDHPFSCFDGEDAISASNTYERLFPSPGEVDVSSKWRVITIERLLEAKQSNSDKAVVETLVHCFEKSVLQPLGYTVEKEADQKKINEMFLASVEFAQFIGKQRAMFQFHVPSGHRRKKLDDTSMTNKDEEFVDDEYELEGDLWFLSRPALVKFGNGMGERLHESTILKKAFVQLVESAEEQS